MTEVLLPQNLIVLNKYVLSKEISALQLRTLDNEKTVSGTFVRLPRGGEIEDFGQYFDAQSLLVRLEGELFVVFKEDLENAGASGHDQTIVGRSGRARA